MGGLVMCRIRHTQQSGGGKGGYSQHNQVCRCQPKVTGPTIGHSSNPTKHSTSTSSNNMVLEFSNNTPQQNSQQWSLCPPLLHPTSLNGHLSPLPPEERLPTLCQEAKVGKIFSSDNHNIYVSSKLAIGEASMLV